MALSLPDFCVERVDPLNKYRANDVVVPPGLFKELALGDFAPTEAESPRLVVGNRRFTLGNLDRRIVIGDDTVRKPYFFSDAHNSVSSAIRKEERALLGQVNGSRKENFSLDDAKRVLGDLLEAAMGSIQKETCGLVDVLSPATHLHMVYEAACDLRDHPELIGRRTVLRFIRLYDEHTLRFVNGERQNELVEKIVGSFVRRLSESQGDLAVSRVDLENDFPLDQLCDVLRTTPWLQFLARATPGITLAPLDFYDDDFGAEMSVSPMRNLFARRVLRVAGARIQERMNTMRCEVWPQNKRQEARTVGFLAAQPDEAFLGDAHVLKLPVRPLYGDDGSLPLPRETLVVQNMRLASH